MTTITLENPWVLLLSVPAVAMLFLLAWLRHRHASGMPAIACVALRGATIFLLLLLLSRPVWVDEIEPTTRNGVALLIDRSESMSLMTDEQTRYDQAVTFARTQLVPALRAANLQVKALLFAEHAQDATGQQIATARPDGAETNLAGAIRQSVAQSDPPPRAVFALTDGATTVDTANGPAIASLVEHHVPFVGIGFGDDSTSRVLELQELVAPAVVAPNQGFVISARLRTVGAEVPGFELVLLRDGKFAARKTVAATVESRIWQETFPRVEPVEGLHGYTVQIVGPESPAVRCTRSMASASVRIADEQELRVLFVQGALTWDYKFIRMALQGDPSIQVSGLSRTADRSTFLQSVENDLDMPGGFPATLEQLAPFRVVVLSNLRPKDLAAPQQELLARFCGELGGGVLMMGGTRTFNISWKDSRLEQLLPVRFAGSTAVNPGSGTFRLSPTDRALRHPVFQIADAGRNRMAWMHLPRFTHVAPVDSVKRGAQVWLEHEHWGGKQHPVLMAMQRYGAGISAVICVENFWRWRLAKDSKPEQFDRFWRQLLRYLAEGGRDAVAITLSDQRLEPNSDIRALLSTRAAPRPGARPEQRFVFRVVNEENRTVTRQLVDLEAGKGAEVIFRCPEEGLYTAEALDVDGGIKAQRSIEIRTRSGELFHTTRNMETLRQWANISGGMAIESEQCADARDLVSEVLEPNHPTRQRTPEAVPAGINGWALSLLLGCLCGEWWLRRHWHMV